MFVLSLIIPPTVTFTLRFCNNYIDNALGQEWPTAFVYFQTHKFAQQQFLRSTL
jgi:hypothetical protein